MSRLLLVRASVFTFRRQFSTTSFDLDGQPNGGKSFAAVPAISAIKVVVGNMPGGKYYKKSMTEMHRLFNAEYGPILRFPGLFGRPPVVFAYDASDYKETFRNEGVWPERLNLESLEYYRKTKRREIYDKFHGLFSSQGEEWKEMRAITNPILMQPKTVKLYCTQVDAIAKEFVGIMSELRDDSGELPADFSNYINSWSLESIAAIALEKRLNILRGSSHDPKAQELIRNIRIFFEKTFEYDGLPSVWKIYQTKGFKEFLKVYDTLTDIIMHYIDEAIPNNEADASPLNVGHEDGVLKKLLKIDKKAAVVMVSDMLLAGVDTTATASINTLYCLAKNPRKQEILREELKRILPDKETKLTADNMKSMPYLRAVMKESFRIIPIVSAIARKVTNSTVLSGYNVPAGTHVVMVPFFETASAKQYPQPDTFIPERWLRDHSDPQCPNAKTANPYTFLPFGFGTRMCIGRRLAELEMEVLVANVIRNFHIEWHHPNMRIKSTFINIPVSDLKFKLIDV